MTLQGSCNAFEFKGFRKSTSPFEGRLAEPTQSNIELVKCGQLKVSLPWLNIKKTMPDLNGHPVTGSSDHYMLYDRFHEANTKDNKDVLRKLTLVPQLSGKVNCQVAGQLFAKMKKIKKNLNMYFPSTHLFQMRNIIHHYNEKQNKKSAGKIEEDFWGQDGDKCVWTFKFTLFLYHISSTNNWNKTFKNPLL